MDSFCVTAASVLTGPAVNGFTGLEVGLTEGFASSEGSGKDIGLCAGRGVPEFACSGAETLLGATCVTGATLHFSSSFRGSSSRSSREKSKSWVDIGGMSSTTEGKVIVEGFGGSLTAGVASEASSRETWVLLSKKSSQQSVGGNGADEVFFKTDVGSTAVNELDLDAGTPGSLKPGFWFMVGFALTAGGVGFLAKLGGGICPVIDGSLNPDLDVSRGTPDGV